MLPALDITRCAQARLLLHGRVDRSNSTQHTASCMRTRIRSMSMHGVESSLHGAIEEASPPAPCADLVSTTDLHPAPAHHHHCPCTTLPPGVWMSRKLNHCSSDSIHPQQQHTPLHTTHPPSPVRCCTTHGCGSWAPAQQQPQCMATWCPLCTDRGARATPLAHHCTPLLHSAPPPPPGLQARQPRRPLGLPLCLLSMACGAPLALRAWPRKALTSAGCAGCRGD